MAKEISWNSGRLNRPAQVVGLVVSAVRNLQNPEGCTLNKIVNYLSEDGQKRAPKRQIITALKRGLDFGIFRKQRGYYYVQSTNDSYFMPGLQIGMGDTVGPTVKRRRPIKMKSTIGRKPRRKQTFPRERRLSFKKGEHGKFSRVTSSPKDYRLADMYHNSNYRMSTASSYAQLGETACH